MEDPHTANKQSYLWARYIILCIFIIIGFQIILNIPRYSSERYPSFNRELIGEDDFCYGTLSINLYTREAFVIGERIDAHITYDAFLKENETIHFGFKFLDTLNNYTELIVKSSESFEAYTYLTYTHEGVFGFNLYLTVRYNGYIIKDTFFFPYFVNIKPYSYLEARRNTHEIKVLNRMILGLAVITICPIFIKLIDICEEITKKSNL